MKQELSPIELSFWYQYKFDPKSDANNIVHHLTLSKKLKKHELENALKKVIKKHPILRTNFIEENGTPFRVTNKSKNVNLLDASNLIYEEALERAQAIFTLESDDLLRVIFVNNKKDTSLFISCPHIVFDAMSWNIFLDDLTAAIGSKSLGASYSVKYDSINPQSHKYWQKRLNDIDGRVSFEQTSQRISTKGNLGLCKKKDTHSVLKELSGFGKTHRLSMNSLCMAILAVTLSKITESQDMIISTPVTTRDEDSIDKIGSYINVLPIPIKVDKNKTFISYAKEELGHIWDDIDNRNFSLINLVRSLSSKHHIDSQGIYNVMSEYIPCPPLNNLITKDEIICNKSTKLDFTLSVEAKENTHIISVEYDKSKFESDYIKTIVEVFITITESILKDPEKTIDSISLIDDKEERNLMKIGSGPIRNITPPFIWNRFKNTAKKNVNRLAITEKDKKISYQKLFDMACRYSDMLKKRGITKGSVVGVYMDRGADYIASMLSIWSLGAIYVPLDTKQPQDRLNYMIDQAGITLVMTHGSSKLTANVKQCDISKKHYETLDSDYEPDGDDIAYIIFTSGSTGTPKGVMIEHKGFLNHLEIMIEDLKLSKDDVIAQTAPVSFDISVWQLVCAFMIGALVTIVDHENLIDPDNMYGTIADDSISVLEVVPSLLSGYLLAEDTDNKLRGLLKQVKVITTGEAISSSIVKQWIENYPNKPLLNAYGPAEASDDTHFFDIISDSIDLQSPIPIGRSLLNIQTYIVNKDLQLCPKGIIGEICIGGIAVAKGYVGNQEMTKKAFLNSPFVNNKESRLYRTGDYGKWRQDNLLEYHGRRDHQVKVRGQRLELGEVEDKLKNLPNIKDAAVIAEKCPSGTRLRGYVVTNSKNTSIDGLRSQLSVKLPDYMIPWKIEIINDLPRSNNGKLDKRALENYSRESSDQTINRQENNSELLNTIIKVYSDVLGATITKDSNYIDNGGDSLQSMKIVALLEESNVSIGIRDVLTYQTPRELAINIGKRKNNTEDWTALQGLTPIQNYYLENAGEEFKDNGEIQAVVISSKLDQNKLPLAISNIVKSHNELMPMPESNPLTIDPIKEEEVNERVGEIRNRISLEYPIVACALKDTQKILLVAHHFVLDFYSWDIIKNELDESTSSKINDDVLNRWWGKSLDALKSNQDKLESSKAFWKSMTDNSGSEVTTSTTETFIHRCSLPESLTKKLKKEKVSLEVFSYYALAKANIAANNQDSFIFNIESSLRTIDNTGILPKGVGWMTYLFPFKMLDNTPLLNFHISMTEAIKRGYEYGLLRYNLMPDFFANAYNSPWVINYLGNKIKSNDDIEVIKVSPKKSKPFIEVDISHDGEKLTFEYSHNTNYPKERFDNIQKNLEKIIKDSSEEHEDDSEIKLSTKRKEDILKRLRNAERD